MRTIEHVAEISGNMPVHSRKQFHIDAESLRPIFQTLINQYSDQKSAILREYSANGRDSHIMAGEKRPVEVILPSHMNRNIVFRDCGVGMSEEEMNNRYAGFGASSKRDSDEVIGNFGLGCKSALSMTPSFTVNTVKDGIKLHCNIIKNAAGMPELVIITKKETDEPNGLEVIIPVKDLEGWEERAKTIFRTWAKGSVLVNGIAPKSVEDEGYEKVGEHGWIGSKGSYRFVTAVMGGINYKVDLNYEARRRFFAGYDNAMSRADVIVNVPMSSLDLVPARDALLMSPRTEETLHTHIQKLIKEFMEQISTKISTADNRIDALRNLENYGFGISRSDVKWKEQEIPTALNFPNGKRYSYRNGRRSSYNDSRVSLPVTATVRTNKTLVVDMDGYTFGRDSILRHLPSYANSQGTSLSEVFIGEPEKDNEWFKAMQEAGVFTLVSATDLSTAAKEYNKANRAARVSTGAASPRDAITYPVITFGENFQWEKEELSILELREHASEVKGKLYYIFEGDTSYHRTENAFTASGPFFTQLARYGAKKNDSVILVSKSRKVESLKSRIGGDLLENIMPVAYAALDAAIKTPITDLSEKIAAYLTQSNHYTRRAIESLAPHVELVKDPEIVKVINMFSGQTIGVNLKTPVDVLFGYGTELSSNLQLRNSATGEEAQEFIDHHPIMSFYCSQGGSTMEKHRLAVIDAINASFATKGSFKK